MNPVVYRIRLAKGFLNEAEEDYSFERWRSCVSNAQLAVENALKALIALYEPVPQTHNPAKILMDLISRGEISSQSSTAIQNILEYASSLSPQIHIQTDYGDEAHGLTPWELFSEEDAREALAIARRVVEMAEAIIKTTGGNDET